MLVPGTWDTFALTILSSTAGRQACRLPIGVSSNIYLFQGIEEQARSQDFPMGGVLFGGKVDLKPIGGGSHMGKNVDLCTIPYMEPLAQGGPPDPPPPGYGPVDCCVFSYMYIYYFCIEKWTSAGSDPPPPPPPRLRA